MIDTLQTPGGRLACAQTAGHGPGIVFLGGFRSDMTGTKAAHLHAWAQAQGRAFLRFDYRGHGQSDGVFENLCLSDWLLDARTMLDRTTGPQVLVGSSMGGWIALLLARENPDRVAGLVTIAAAPDFTVTTWHSELTEEQRQDVHALGRTELPSAYGAPYVFTRKLFQDGAQNLVLDQPLPLPMPTRFLQGTADTDVLPQVAHRLLDHATGPDLRLTLVKGADHRFSTPACLRLIETAIAEVLGNRP